VTTPVLPWATAEQVELYEHICGTAGTIADDLVERDRDGRFSDEAWTRYAELGIPALPIPEELGGGGADAVTTMLALEAFGYACRDGGLVFSLSAHMWTSEIPLWMHGTVEQQARWLPGLCDGTYIGCHTITEPDAGSDAFAMRASARPVEAGWVLNGRKTFITNAPIADVFIVFARIGETVGPFGITAFLVPRGTEGLSVDPPAHKMGLRTSPMSDVVLDECFVPAEAVVGEPGRGAAVFQTSMTWERACIMASQVGTMRRTLEACVDYARSRSQFGQSIGRFESVADKIANMKIAVEASRALVLRTGWLMDHGFDTTTEAAVAKTFVSEASVRTHLDAIQVHGGYGYMTELELERDLRDAVGGTIYSGTSEIQRRIIARGLGL
jgi:alkylation response protein AidB-like acyl-CoA dehydrogenase